MSFLALLSAAAAPSPPPPSPPLDCLPPDRTALLGNAGALGEQWCYEQADYDDPTCENYYVEHGAAEVINAPGYVPCSAGCRVCGPHQSDPNDGPKVLKIAIKWGQSSTA